MRQFVFGILAAALALWGYQRWQGEQQPDGTPSGTGQVQAGAGAPGAGPANGGPMRIDDVFGRTAGRAETPANVGQTNALPAANVEVVVAAIGNGDVAGIDAGWGMLAAGLPAVERQRLAGLLVPTGDEFGPLVKALGSRNAFLFSEEGRQLAARAWATLTAMTDAQKCAGGSHILGLCLRGRIERQDELQRKFVDGLWNQHRAVVDRWLCDPANVTGARSHKIEPGKSLAVVANKFRKEGIHVDASSLAVLNRIHNPNVVQAGQAIKIPVAPIRAVLEKRSYSLAVYVGEDLLRLYWVGHGADDKTPVTEFTVVEKQERPEWTAPDGKRYPYGHPENILGEYFIKFQHASYTGFGAHGTPQPETICTMSSAGCIRMLADDITDLFKVLPRGAVVEVRASAW